MTNTIKNNKIGRNRKNKKRNLRKLRRQRKAKRQQSGSGCRCTASGDVHYYIFSGTKVDVQGICKYTLSRSSAAFPYPTCNWNIEVKNERRGSKTTVSYTKLADIYICGTKIAAMQGGAVRVDDFEVSALSHDVENCGITVKKETGELEIYSSECDITVLWDGRSKLVVDVPKNYSQYAEGICGDCTDRNQFILSDETDISSLPKGERNVKWGKEWEVIDDTEEELIGCPASAPTPECTADQMKLLATDEYCGILNPERTGAGESPFAVCIQKDVELAKKLYMSCVLDVCMFLNVPYKQEALCLAVDAMAQNCRKNNYDYKEWRKSHSCEMKCKENSRYEFSSKCPATCENKSPTEDDCDLPALEGCVCNEGYFLDDKECVEESKCGCIADDEEYYKIGAIRREKDCTLEEQCMPGGEMKEIWKNEGCHKNGWCVVKNGNYECECKANYRGDGREKCDEIPAGCVKTEKVSGNSGRCKRHRKNRKLVICTIRSADKLMNVEIVSSKQNKKQNKTNKRNRKRKGKGKKNKKESKKGKRAKQRRRRRNRRNKCRVVGKLRRNRFFTRGNCRRAIFRVTFLSKAGSCENNCGENAIFKNGKCRCPRGYTGDPKKKCAQFCTCISAGDPHIRTFDRAMLHVMGICKYILSALVDTKDPCAYTVETTTEKRNSRPVSYNKRVDFTIGNVVYSILKGNEVLINGQQVSVPQNLDAENIVITREERSIVIRHTKCEIDVSYDGRHKVMVQAPFSAYSGRVTGMCGNCNRDKEDDYLDGDGNLAKERALHYRLGQKWKSPGESCEAEAPLATCSAEATKQAERDNKCGLLNSKTGLFKEAFEGDLNLLDMYGSCVFDACENLESDAHCPILEEAVNLASQSGIRIDLTTWRDVTSCPLKCDKTFVESKEVTCIPSCMISEPDTSSECTIAPYRGCTCESGKVEKDDLCVDIAECDKTCAVESNGNTINVDVGDTFPARSECGNFKKCVESDGELNLQDNTDVKCPGENTKCEIQDGTGKCGCADGFEPDTDDSSNCKEKNDEPKDCKDIRVNTEGENNIQFLSDLNIKSLKSASLKFAVKSRKVAHILLMTSKSKNDPHYEIIIGSESSIVSNGKELDSHKGRLLNHRRSIAFGISWTNGVIKLTNGNRREIMSGKDQSEPLDIIDIGISTDSTGDWIFYCAGISQGPVLSPNEKEPPRPAACTKDVTVDCTAETRKWKSCKVEASDLKEVADIELLKGSCKNTEYRLRMSKNDFIVRNKCSGKFRVTYRVKDCGENSPEPVPEPVALGFKPDPPEPCEKDITVKCTAETKKWKSCRILEPDLKRVVKVELLEGSCKKKDYKLRRKKVAIIVRNKCSGNFKVTYRTKGCKD
ncbi:IgGFc-binding protein-like [Mytilus galloprovincialis]|uniref:IgGFc-binding protein-like n=1 Tax=Mytilus galloprovincialis TaxID=29158 RepID=UPI003F7CB9F3